MSIINKLFLDVLKRRTSMRTGIRVLIEKICFFKKLILNSIRFNTRLNSGVFEPFYIRYLGHRFLYDIPYGRAVLTVSLFFTDLFKIFSNHSSCSSGSTF